MDNPGSSRVREQNTWVLAEPGATARTSSSLARVTTSGVLTTPDGPAVVRVVAPVRTAQVHTWLRRGSGLSNPTLYKIVPERILTPGPLRACLPCLCGASICSKNGAALLGPPARRAASPHSEALLFRWQSLAIAGRSTPC